MKKSSNFLYILFYAFLTIDVILLIVFFLNPKLLQKPVFKTYLPQYLFSKGEIKIEKGVSQEGSTVMGTISLNGVIESDPFFEKKTNSYILPIEFINKNGVKLTLNLVLGTNKENLALLMAKDGVIANNVQAKRYTVEKSLPLFTKNNTIIASYFYESPNFLNKALSNKDCLETCQKFINKISLYAPNTDLLLNNYKLNSSQFIGPAFSFIIYDK